MIDKKEVIAFFDSWASGWDAGMVCDDRVIDMILDNAGVHASSKVLDVACGTGVLIPYYLKRNVSSVTGVDISPGMIAVARSKFSQSQVKLVCADAETDSFGTGFDSIVIYNAFPHFSDPQKLMENLCTMLAPGAVLTVAHGMSRDRVNSHHSGSASRISNGLPEADALAALFSRYLEVTAVISDYRMYQVCGKSR
ncbi:MAG: class I SAM-dependent methyltransferase [bacterium]|nr:class I SAM-dependent methyltransferase [bacterium]